MAFRGLWDGPFWNLSALTSSYCFPHSAPTTLTSLLFLKWNKYAPLSRSLPFLFCLEFSSWYPAVSSLTLFRLLLKFHCQQGFPWTLYTYMYLPPLSFNALTSTWNIIHSVCIVDFPQLCQLIVSRCYRRCYLMAYPRNFEEHLMWDRHWNKYLFNGLDGCRKARADIWCMSKFLGTPNKWSCVTQLP